MQGDKILMLFLKESKNVFVYRNIMICDKIKLKLEQGHMIRLPNTAWKDSYINYIDLVCLVGLYGKSNIVDYLMPNLLYTYTSNTYDLGSLGFMAYQPLLGIKY